MTIETYERKSKFSELSPYDPCAPKNSFMEVCEWYNGEGFDITIDNKQFQFTWGSGNAYKSW